MSQQTPPNNTAPDQQPPSPAQSPAPPNDTTFIDDGAPARLVAAGLAREDAERMVDNINRLIATGIPRDMAIHAVGSHPGKIEQGIGAALTGLIQGLGIPLADVARVNDQNHPDIWPGLWPGINESTPATVAPDLPAPVSAALGFGGGLSGVFAKFAMLGKAISIVPGFVPAAGRFISALLDHIPVPAAAALAQAIRTGPKIYYLPGEAAPAATATRTAAGVTAGAGKAARVLSDAERRRLLLQEIEKAVAAANERAGTGSPPPPTPRP